METVEAILAYVEQVPIWWGLCVLMFAAAFEYVFPPFPGDSVTLIGAVLIPTADWPWWAVFAAVMLGSMLGAALDWRVGIWLQERREGERPGFLARPKVSARLSEIVDKFDRHGPKFLALNRFLPAFRALFFVAAGMARLRLKVVLFWAALSAAAWNALVLGVGWAVGYNLETLVGLLEQYTTVAVGLFVAVIVIWLLVKSRGSE